jgi:hypothetical protein
MRPQTRFFPLFTTLAATLAASSGLLASAAPPAKVAIVYARYGGNCGLPKEKADISKQVGKQCNGKTYCAFKLDWSLWGGSDPSPSLCAPKDVQIAWTCGGSSKQLWMFSKHMTTPQVFPISCSNPPRRMSCRGPFGYRMGTATWPAADGGDSSAPGLLVHFSPPLLPFGDKATVDKIPPGRCVVRGETLPGGILAITAPLHDFALSYPDGNFRHAQQLGAWRSRAHLGMTSVLNCLPRADCVLGLEGVTRVKTGKLDDPSEMLKPSSPYWLGDVSRHSVEFIPYKP